MKTVSTSFKGLTRILLLMFTFASAGFLVACDNDGPVEDAGEQIDNAVDDAADALDPQGPAEETGEAIDDAMDDAEDSMNQ
jgi:hypothetical protein